MWRIARCCVFTFTDPSTTEIYTLSLHDALPISGLERLRALTATPRDRMLLVGDSPIDVRTACAGGVAFCGVAWGLDRKSTRLNSSHSSISYAVFCLKKKKKA